MGSVVRGLASLTAVETIVPDLFPRRPQAAPLGRYRSK